MKMIRNIPIIHPDHGRTMLADLSYTETSERKPIIIFCHGFKGFKDWGHWDLIAKYFASRGYAFLKFNFSHNGTTVNDPGNFGDLDAFSQNNYSKELSDLEVVINHTLDPQFEYADQIDPEKLILIGHSKGGAVALIKSNEDSRTQATVAWAPIYDIDSRWPKNVQEEWKEQGVRYVENARTGQQMPLDYQMVQDYLDNRDRLNIPKAIRSITRPLLIVHGDEDEAINYEEGMMASLWNQEMQFETIDDAGHTFGGKHPMTESTLPAHSQLLVDKTIQFLNGALSG
ncbi:MAG: alpha/beta hydrolase [Cyclobacteriaceae bacterium]